MKGHKGLGALLGASMVSGGLGRPHGPPSPFAGLDLVGMAVEVTYDRHGLAKYCSLVEGVILGVRGQTFFVVTDKEAVLTSGEGELPKIGSIIAVSAARCRFLNMEAVKAVVGIFDDDLEALDALDERHLLIEVLNLPETTENILVGQEIDTLWELVRSRESELVAKGLSKRDIPAVKEALAKRGLTLYPEDDDNKPPRLKEA